MLASLAYIVKINIKYMCNKFNPDQIYIDRLFIGLCNLMGFLYMCLIILTIYINVQYKYMKCQDHYHFNNRPRPLYMNMLNFTAGLGLPVTFFYIISYLVDDDAPIIIYINTLHGMLYGLVLIFISYL